MFTGLVEAMGVVERLEAVSSGSRLVLALPDSFDSAAIGDSIAINGCCLTVVSLDGKRANFDVGPETLRRTNLGQLVPGDRVNLERSLTATTRLGGHFVQGHIDGVASIRTRQRDGDWETVWFQCGDLAASLVAKGSIAVDGVSLTISDVEADAFSVMLIPHTMAMTTLGTRQVNSIVNIETDILGKYVLRVLSQVLSEGNLQTMNRLRAAGIIAP